MLISTRDPLPTDGNIPSSMQRKVLETAWDRGIRITAHEIIFGRDEN